MEAVHTDHTVYFDDFQAIVKELDGDLHPIGIREWWMEFLAVSTRLFTNPIFMHLELWLWRALPPDLDE